MEVLDYSLKRVDSVLKTIKGLKDIDFPYQHSKDALTAIEDQFRDLQKPLTLAGQGVENIDSVQNICSISLRKIFEYLPLLGFILRSTNVRNAFEIHGPLLRLARKLLGTKTKLLISSEWDHSPLMYSDIPDLPGFVLIGFPSTESANPLLLPLAGHELGHSVWVKHGLEDAMKKDIIKKEVIKIILEDQLENYLKYYDPVSKPEDFEEPDVNAVIAPIVDWAAKQAEESFCDFIGIRLFGICFLDAFSLLLAPVETEGRVVFYPEIRTRVLNQMTAAKTYEFQIPMDYSSMFVAEQVTAFGMDEETKFVLNLSDIALSHKVPYLIEMASQIVDKAGVPKPDQKATRKVLDQFELALPAQKARNLSNILNAGWLAFKNPEFWQNYPQIQNRDECLKEIMLKSIEILEYESLTKGGK